MGYMGVNCFAKTLLSRYLCLFYKKKLILRVRSKTQILRVTNVKKSKSHASKRCQVGNTALAYYVN